MELCRVCQLTHSQENILDLQWLDSSEMSPDELEAVARNVVAHLRHLLDQRNTHLEVPSFYLFCFLGFFWGKGGVSYNRFCAKT